MIPAPTEAQEQSALFRWAAYSTGAYPELQLLYHVPNGGSRNRLEAHNLKLQGVKPGVPDIVLPVARGQWHGLYIELKRTEKGRLSEAQKWWLEALTRAGYRAVCCKGWKAAQEEIIRYLNVPE